MTDTHLSADLDGPFPAAVDRFFDYLQDGVAVNRGIAAHWSQAWGSPVELARVALRTPIDFAEGHGRAISTWLTDETLLTQQGLAGSFAAATDRVVEGSVTDLGDRRAAATARD